MIIGKISSIIGLIATILSIALFFLYQYVNSAPMAICLNLVGIRDCAVNFWDFSLMFSVSALPFSILGLIWDKKNLSKVILVISVIIFCFIFGYTYLALSSFGTL